MKIKELIPKDKSDFSNIDKLYGLTDEEIKPIIYELLEWLQDYNWPVAQKLVPVLNEREDLVFPYISTILNGNDNMWKYWIMELLIPNFTKKHKEELKEDLLKLTNLSGEDEDSIRIRECAIECYKKIDVKNQ